MPDAVTAFNLPIPAPSAGAEWAPREDAPNADAQLSFRRELARVEGPDTGASDRRRSLDRKPASNAASEPSSPSEHAANCDTAEGPNEQTAPQDAQETQSVSSERETPDKTTAAGTENAPPAGAKPRASPSPQPAAKVEDIAPDAPTTMPGAGLAVPVEMQAAPAAIVEMLSALSPGAIAEGTPPVPAATPTPALDTLASTTPMFAAASSTIEPTASISGVPAPDKPSTGSLVEAADMSASAKKSGQQAMENSHALQQPAGAPTTNLGAPLMSEPLPAPVAVAPNTTASAPVTVPSAASGIAPEIAAAIPVQLAAIAMDGEKPKAAPTATIEAAAAKAAGTASGLATAFPDALNSAQPPQHPSAQNAPAASAGAQTPTPANANAATSQPSFGAELAAQQDSQVQPAPVPPGGIASTHPATAGSQSVVQAQANPARIPPETLAYEIKRQHANGVNRFEIRLDPPELGRIDVRLEVAGDGSTRAHLSADRADTLDLLQRDARTLERALNTLGLKTDRDGIAFSLRQDGAEAGLNREARDGHRNGAPGFFSLADEGDELTTSAAAQARESSRYSNMRLNIVI